MKTIKKLSQCIITLNRNCNLRCDFCYAKKTGYKKDEYIEYDYLKKIVDFCCDAEVKYVIFTGGEPTLYPELLHILQYIKCKKYKMIPTIATNGIKLQDKNYCKQLLENGIEYVDISLKGKDAEEWISSVGFDYHEQQLKAIGNLALLDADFTCSMVITHNNVHTYCETVKNAFENGARKFSFTFVIDNEESAIKDIGYLEKNNPLRLINNFFSHISELNSITHGEWWIEYSLPLCIYSEEQLALLEGRLAVPCHVYDGSGITFDAKMNLMPCSMFINLPTGQFGKDFYSYLDFEEYRKQGVYNDIVNSLNHIPSKECLECKHKEKCMGGCPIFWKNCSFSAFKKFLYQNRKDENL